MGIFLQVLQKHVVTTTVAVESEKLLIELRQLVRTRISIDEFQGITIYFVGSLGRNEIGVNSDLDIYSISQEQVGVGSGDRFFPAVIAALRSHSADSFAIDQKCLQNFSCEKLSHSIGTSKDDYENSFTARMLLLLESQFLINEANYLKCIDTIISSYFQNRSFRVSNFSAIFLLDDILRFWKTLCVNYEVSSYSGTRPLALKSISLRFNRALTIFSTILNIVLIRNFGESDMVALTRLTPLQRLANAMDIVNDASLLDEYASALDLYYSFLLLKQRPNIENMLEADSELREEFLAQGNQFTDFLFGLLNGPIVDSRIKKHMLF